MNKIPTVTVALSAFNESKNIANWITSVINQIQDGFIIKNIIIHSDGSDDNTVNIVKSINDKRITVIDHKMRLGKSERLNEIYRELDDDILVQSDADIVFKNKKVIKNLIDPIIKNSTIMMTGGNPIPIKGITFVEKAVNITYESYNYIRTIFNHGNSVFSVDGRLLAYRKSFVKQFKIPNDMIANDKYTYLVCKSYNYEYRFAPYAKVVYRSPQTLKDQIKQNSRFLAATIRFKRLFSKNLIKKEYEIPKNKLAKNILLNAIKNPGASLFIFVINIYCRINAAINEQKMGSKWQMAVTTKKIL
jgi:cellulose synthase/poly-beta-1,6-N-acetylglucosamine synthase-like glycosyltransferase